MFGAGCTPSVQRRSLIADSRPAVGLAWWSSLMAGTPKVPPFAHQHQGHCCRRRRTDTHRRQDRKFDFVCVVHARDPRL